jgi:hypothetical protein
MKRFMRNRSILSSIFNYLIELKLTRKASDSVCTLLGSLGIISVTNRSNLNKFLWRMYALFEMPKRSLGVKKWKLYLNVVISSSLEKMRIFYSLNSFVVTRNVWPDLPSKISLFFSKTYIKQYLKFQGSQICADFCFSFIGCWFIHNFVIFNYMKVAKCIRDLCCHLVTETGR